jgi:hypothetical protein
MFNILMVQINQRDKIARIFSEKGIVITLIIPILGLVVSIIK